MPPALVAPAPAWSGDYETGSFSQWHTQFLGGDWCGAGCTLDNVGNATGRIVVSPVAEGRYAARFQVSSSGGGVSGANRAEVLATQSQTGGYQGQSWWYGWWTRFPGPSQSWWPNGDDFNDIFQFFDQANQEAFIYGGVAANDGSPALYTDGPWGHRVIADPLRYDHWYHFVVHATWSPTAGYWQLRLDGQIRQSFSGPTMGQSAHPSTTYSQGFYSARNTDNTVIHDGFCRASTRRAAVAC